MDEFQIQSQWEDESQDPNGGLSTQKKAASLQVTKRSVVIVVAVATIAICAMIAVFIFGRRIEGVWIRQVDDNNTLAGMTVEVRKNNGILEGTIIAMPEGAEAFEVGQNKWIALRKTGFGIYLGKSLVSHSDGTYSYGNNDSVFTVLSGGKIMTMQSSEADVSKGSYQVWVKQK